MKNLIFKNYELSMNLLFTIIITGLFVLFDTFFIQNNYAWEYIGLGLYFGYMGLASCISALTRKVTLWGSITPELFKVFALNTLKWWGAIFIFVGCVNEFNIQNAGGIIGSWYQSHLYEIFPYYGVVFAALLILYAQLFRFPTMPIFIFLSELVGEALFLLYHKLISLFGPLFGKMGDIKFKRRRKEINLNFEAINETPYLKATDRVQPDEVDFDVEPTSLQPIKEQANELIDELPDTHLKPEIQELAEQELILREDIPVGDTIPLEDDVFNQFSEQIASGAMAVERRMDGKETDSDDETINMLNTAFKHMNLPRIQIFPKARPGPIVTTYELKLPDSMVISKLDDVNKLKDLTRRLKVKTLRLKYNQGGTDHVFLEVPNAEPTDVEFKPNLLKLLPEMKKQNLPLFVGVDTEGNPRSFDLTKFPHMLVAGATNSGKTVGIHSMISSMLSVRSEEEVKLVMIDPKLMEFVYYSNSPYLLDLERIDSEYVPIDDIAAKQIEKFRSGIEDSLSEPVDNEEGDIDMNDAVEVVGHYDEFQVTDGIVCDMGIVPEILSKLVFLMQVRLLRLRAMRASNLQEFNENVRAKNGIHTDKQGVEREVKEMPYIVLVIDELADLMEEYGDQVKGYIKRLAQKARAVGIHLILCTQRPSVDVVDGVIKASMPVRLSYSLATAIDAKTVGVPDAEKLLGRGDSMIKTNEEHTRLHGAYIKTDQVVNICKAKMSY